MADDGNLGEFVGETRATMRALTESVRELKDGFRKLVDKLEENSKEFSQALQPIGDFRRDITDILKRMAAAEAEIKVLRDWQLTTKTQLVAYGSVGGAIIATAGWLINKIWK